LVKRERSTRRPFTMPEVSKILSVADTEWRTMILLGFYTGLRLSDCANLTWREVDLLKGEIKVQTQKTARDQELPIAEPLLRHLASIAGDDPDAPLCPTLAGKPSHWVSQQFHNKVMVPAGLAEARDHISKGRGRDARRERAAISFHSLRYTATSELKSAGVSDAVAKDIIGHETDAISRHYGKIAFDSKKQAVNKLPDVLR
jgi:integrase